VIHDALGTSYAFSEAENNFARPEALEVVTRLGGVAHAAGPLPADFDPSLSYGQTRRIFELEFERRYVSWLLVRHQGNISAAAREARMDRKHLHDLAKKHGLRQPRAIERR
jgi:DNA-binding NtrC family response regulator